MNDYQIYSLIINFFVAIGTVGAVVISIVFSLNSGKPKCSIKYTFLGLDDKTKDKRIRIVILNRTQTPVTITNTEFLNDKDSITDNSGDQHKLDLGDSLIVYLKIADINKYVEKAKIKRTIQIVFTDSSMSHYVKRINYDRLCRKYKI